METYAQEFNRFYQSNFGMCTYFNGLREIPTIIYIIIIILVNACVCFII